MSITRCHTIAKEIIHGEERMAEDARARPQLLSLLGLTVPAKTQVGAERSTSTTEKDSQAQAPFPLTSTTQKLRPFEQKPKRHTTDPKRRFA
jgi:hypothetical protein